MKYWINLKPNEEKIIAIANGIFYTSSPSENQTNQFKAELQRGIIPERLTGTPFNQIKTIDFEDSRSKIILHCANDSQEILVSDKRIRSEIKGALENITPKYLSRETFTKSKLQISTKPLIGIFVVSALTFWIHGIAVDIQTGAKYTSEDAFGNLFLGLAEMGGTAGVLGIGAFVISVISYKLYTNLKEPLVVEQFKYTVK